jgi:hypothetical protein
LHHDLFNAQRRLKGLHSGKIGSGAGREKHTSPFQAGKAKKRAAVF